MSEPVTKDGTVSLVDPRADTQLPRDVSRVSPRARSALAYTAAPPSGAGAYDLAQLPTVDPGRYDLLDEIGRGGLGRVVRAFDRRLQRIVAVKEMLDGGGSTARFVHEAIATAGLEHPGIIPVHDAGRWPDGAPFYAMKLVSGRSLADVIAEKATLEERLALLPNVIAMADAMAYAHSRELVHRDLKPANVLVGAFGETVIIDWGIAKSLRSDPSADGARRSGDGARDPEGGALTVAGAVLGTPAYMPPEQAAGKEVDARADVYALGAILYQVLAGQPPHDAGSKDVLQRILAGAPVPLEERQPGIAPDLRTIVRKAMARDPGERYPTASELADDLRRFQTGQLVSSHRYSPWALGRRWLGRHRVVVALSATLLGALVVVGGVSIRRVIRARVIAEAAQARAEAATREAVSRTNAALLSQARALLDVDPTAAIAVLGTYPEDAGDWEGASSLATEAWSRGVARHVFRSPGELSTVAFSPDGQWLAGGGADKLVHVWNVATGTERRFPPSEKEGGHEGEIGQVVASPDGRWVVSAGPFDARIRVWDAKTGEGRALVGHEEGVRWIGISASGVLASTSRDRTLRVWDLTTGEGRVLVRYAEMRDCGRVAITGDGRTIAYGGVKRVHLVDVATGHERALAGMEAGTGALAFSRDDRALVSGGMDSNVRVWDMASSQVRVLRGHKAWVSGVALSPDGGTLVSEAGEGAAWVWNLGTGEGHMLPAAVGDVRALAFAPDGRAVALAGDDRLIRIWSLPSLVPRVLRGHAAPIAHLAFAPDGRTLASASLDHSARIWDLEPGGLRALPLPEGSTASVQLSADGRHVALVRESEHTAAVYLADLPGGDVHRLGDADSPAPSATLASASQHLDDTAGDALRLFVADGGSCGLGRRLQDLHTCAYSPDGTAAASGGLDKTVRLWSAKTDALRVIGRHEGSVLSVAFSPDGRALASGSTDRTVRIWDVATGAERVLRGHESAVEDVAFTSDGAKVGSASMDGTLRVWDLATGEARVFRGDQLAARALAFSPDGRFALVGERSGAVRVWDLATARARVVLRHGGFVRSIRVTPDGARVLSSGGDGSTWLWDFDPTGFFSDGPVPVRRWMRSITHAALDVAGKPATPTLTIAP